MRVGIACLAVFFALEMSGAAFAQAPFRIVDAIDAGSDLVRAGRIAKVELSERLEAPAGARDDLPGLKAQIESILRRARAEGGGADIGFQTLTAIQTDYITDSACPPDCGGGEPCNVVLLFWDETQFNPDGVDIYVDDVLTQHLPGLPADQVPGTNITFLPNVDTGARVFRVEDPNTLSFDDIMLTVVDIQPFGDVAHVQCGTGPMLTDGTCAILVGHANAGPLPDENLVLVTDSVNTEAPLLPIPRTEFYIPQSLNAFVGLPEDNYQFTFLGFKNENPGDSRAQYRGCRIPGGQCSFSCQNVSCAPPFHVWVAQIGYGPNFGESVVMTLWFLGLEWQGDDLVEAPYAGGINLFDGGQPINPGAPLDGDIIGIILNGGPGDHRLGIQGDCGGDPSSVTEFDFRLPQETPLTSPVVGGLITLNYDAGTQSTTATWTNDQRSAFISVYTVPDPAALPANFPDIFPDALIEGGLPGSSATYTMAGTVESDFLMFQFFTYVGDIAFGSEPILGQFGGAPEDFFVRGLCSGAGSSPQITDPIFLFTYLFLGGDAPPCEEACDANASGRLELTDGIIVLNFLFLGGPPPTNWVGSDATCEPFTGVDQLSCQTPLARCTGPGPIVDA